MEMKLGGDAIFDAYDCLLVRRVKILPRGEKLSSILIPFRFTTIKYENPSYDTQSVVKGSSQTSLFPATPFRRRFAKTNEVHQAPSIIPGLHY